MESLKKWELLVEATSFDGSQTFACEAVDEAEALIKFKAGLCDIIEVNVEVLGLENTPFDIEESSDISSRLSGAVNNHLVEENAELRKALVDLLECKGILTSDKECVINAKKLLNN